MNTLTFTKQINAPKEKVWDIMLGEDTYREWTDGFHAGSYFKGTWEKGSTMYFVALGDDNTESGMLCEVAENIPYERVSLEMTGMVNKGVEDTTSDEAKKWAGSLESYSFSEADGVTTVTIELEGTTESAEMAEMFKTMWPKALNKLKEITEQ